MNFLVYRVVFSRRLFKSWCNKCNSLEFSFVSYHFLLHVSLSTSWLSWVVFKVKQGYCFFGLISRTQFFWLTDDPVYLYTVSIVLGLRDIVVGVTVLLKFLIYTFLFLFILNFLLTFVSSTGTTTLSTCSYDFEINLESL